MSHTSHSFATWLRLLWLAALPAACGHSTLGWGRNQPEDPAPTGPAYLRDYKESHYRSVGREFTGALDAAAFDRALDRSAVLWLGDHHEDTALHDRMIGLLTDLAKQREIVIGLEAVGIEDEPLIGRYLAGSIDLDSTCQLIAARWGDSWLSHASIDSRFYRAVLGLARAQDTPVFALEPTPRLPLAERDALIATRVRAIRGQLADHRLIVVIVGHTHLLGDDKLIERIRLPSVIVGARLSRSLRESYRPTADRSAAYLQTDEGVLFFNPPPDL